MSESTDFLAKVSIFSLMKHNDLKRIAKIAVTRHYQKGEIIIREGERDGRLFVIVSGEVDVLKNMGTKKEKHLSSLGPYSYFGEMALIDDLARSASVVAKQKVRVLSLDKLNLRQEINKYPGLAFELLQMLSRRIRVIEKNMMKVFGSLLPICANCKKIRNEEDVWISIERYISDHSETEFSHGICPECAKALYPGILKDK